MGLFVCGSLCAHVHIHIISYATVSFCQEFAKVVEPENMKQDIIPLFHSLASDEQVREGGREVGREVGREGGR